MTGPAGLDTRDLALRLYQRGVVVEPGDVFFANNKPPGNHLRIGYSSIALESIEPGVRIIAQELVRETSGSLPPRRTRRSQLAATPA